MLNVGLVNYANAYPLNAAFRAGKVAHDATIIYDTPSALNKKLEEGSLDLALTSSVFYLNHQDAFDILTDFGISTSGSSMSVHLYIKESIESLDRATVGLTTESAASIALLKVLCSRYWKVDPNFEKLAPGASKSGYAGFLLIGDEALKQQTIKGYHTIDLATAWHEKSRLNFPFAVFAVSRVAQTRKRVELEQFGKALEEAYAWGKENVDEVIQLAQEVSDVDSKVLKTYFKTLRYRLDKEDMRGLAAFDFLRNPANVFSSGS